MARRIHSRYKISGTLISQSPIHVGGLGGNADTDLALAVNGKGKYYIPGTSLAGALRAWMDAIDSKATQSLWGYQDQKVDKGHASFILVEDAVISNADSIVPEIRDGVGIDRDTGTAAEHMKYDRAILPRGVKIPLQLTLERDATLSDSTWQEYQGHFAQLLNALQEGQISIGAAKTRGLGRVKLYDLKVKEQQLLTSQGMLDTLLRGGSNVSWSELLSANPVNAVSQIEVTIQWKPVSPVMVKAEGDGIAVDILPLVSGLDGDVTFVLPGSSIKGSLRSQAERIIRTVCNTDIPQNFADQVQVDLVKTLFGSPAQLDQSEKPEQLGYLGALGIDDCFANIPIPSSDWANVENATKEDNLRQALDAAKLQHTQQAFHVAIDRWTGGAADGFLYSILEPMGFSWQPINLSLNLKRLEKKKEDSPSPEYLPSVALFLLLLRDLLESRIPLGFGTNRGMGAIEIQQIQFKCLGDLNGLSPLANTTLTQRDLSEIDKNLLEELNNEWKEWIDGARTKNV